MEIETLLQQVRSGELAIEEAKAILAEYRQVADIGFAQVDLDRERRIGFPEVIYGEGKRGDQIAAIFRKLMEHADRVLATRVSPDKAAVVRDQLPEAVYHEQARALAWTKEPLVPVGQGHVAVVCAGTSDLPVAEEAAITAEMLGCRVERVYDVGVAGIHRLFRRLPIIRQADVVVVVAGMEGALPSVVGGLVSRPIIAVPTSIGYGANFHGLSALLSMLNSCSPGITVVNIDNGFGGGYAAGIYYRHLYQS